MLEKVAFTTYRVEDMERARRFYKELGMKEGFNHEDSYIEYDLPEGGCFAITTLEKIVPAGATAIVAFEVDDMDETVKQLPKDAKVITPPFETGVCRMAVISDAEGNSMILHKLKR